MQPGSDGRDRAAEDLGDLAVGQVGPVAEDDDRSALVGGGSPTTTSRRRSWSRRRRQRTHPFTTVRRR
jgi:hypothetical protein